MDTIKFMGLMATAILFNTNALASVWTYNSKVDKFTDNTVYTASVNSGDGFITARCDEKKQFELYLSVGEFIGSRANYDVRYRIDKNNLESSKWSPSSNGTSVFATNPDKFDVARKLMFGDFVLVEVTDFRGTPHQSRYSLKGSARAIGRVLDACGISHKETVVEGIDTAVSREIAMWGIKNTRCKKEMLIKLGYPVSEVSSEKSEDLYRALQKYVDDKYSLCGTGKLDQFEERHACRQKEQFVRGLYGDAVKSDISFKDSCGSLYLGD